MNKKEISTVLAAGTRREKQIDEVIERLGSVIQESFSALTNLAPDIALEVLNQLKDHEKSIEQLADDQQKSFNKLVKLFENNFTYTEEE